MSATTGPISPMNHMRIPHSDQGMGLDELPNASPVQLITPRSLRERVNKLAQLRIDVPGNEASVMPKGEANSRRERDISFCKTGKDENELAIEVLMPIRSRRSTSSGNPVDNFRALIEAVGAMDISSEGGTPSPRSGSPNLQIPRSPKRASSCTSPNLEVPGSPRAPSRHSSHHEIPSPRSAKTPELMQVREPTVGKGKKPSFSFIINKA